MHHHAISKVTLRGEVWIHQTLDEGFKIIKTCVMICMKNIMRFGLSFGIFTLFPIKEVIHKGVIPVGSKFEMPSVLPEWYHCRYCT